MSADPFHPPTLDPPAAAFARRRAHLLREIDRRHRVVRRRALLALAVVLVAILLPVAALAVGIGGDWWLVGEGLPTPKSAVVTVKTGSWDGHRWELDAYRVQDGVCVAMSPPSSRPTEVGGAFACHPLGVFPVGTERFTWPLFFNTGGGDTSDELPAYVVGSVVDSIYDVVVRFDDGTVLRTPTFAGPSELGEVRFYAARRRGIEEPVRLTGLGRDGRVVGCLEPPPPGVGEVWRPCR